MLVFHPQRYYDSDCDNWRVSSNFHPLPTLQFHDVATKEAGNEVVDDACSICLVEFKGDDTVSQLDKCQHVFHTCCIQRWLHEDHFTCPLCRSNLVHVISCQVYE
ncbi:hypothetical protein OSB04_025864 [Centaurea solstitialis]|uniref:RING-type domain-containing protein n=1 Tax=Centaurea solstitialis TaxID=347529 RepID=A0AA38W250_9ASTR|nr:hypothetical protein OSB04_025864 [Centaurea solstitialis]